MRGGQVAQPGPSAHAGTICGCRSRRTAPTGPLLPAWDLLRHRGGVTTRRALSTCLNVLSSVRIPQPSRAREAGVASDGRPSSGRAANTPAPGVTMLTKKTSKPQDREHNAGIPRCGGHDGARRACTLERLCRPRRPTREIATFAELHGHETILFVEDEASLRRIAVRALQPRPPHGRGVVPRARRCAVVAAARKTFPACSKTPARIG